MEKTHLQKKEEELLSLTADLLFADSEERLGRFTNNSFVRFIPVDILKMYAEVDRSDIDANHTDLNYLACSMQRAGLVEPLVFSVTKHNKGYVTDGNHRLAAVSKTDINVLPVIFENIDSADPHWGENTPKKSRIYSRQPTAEDYGFQCFTCEGLLKRVEKCKFRDVLIGDCSEDGIRHETIQIKSANSKNHGVLGFNKGVRWRFRPYTGMLALTEISASRAKRDIEDRLREFGFQAKRVLPIGHPDAFTETHSSRLANGASDISVADLGAWEKHNPQKAKKVNSLISELKGKDFEFSDKTKTLFNLFEEKNQKNPMMDGSKKELTTSTTPFRTI